MRAGEKVPLAAVMGRGSWWWWLNGGGEGGWGQRVGDRRVRGRGWRLERIA